MGNREIKPVGNFADYLKVAIICDLIFAIPCITILLSLGLIELNYAYLFFGLSVFIKTPIVGGFAWLIAKGSIGENNLLVLKVIGAIPGMYFGFITGSSMDMFRFSQPYIFTILILIFFILGTIAGTLLGPKIGKRIMLRVS